MNNFKILLKITSLIFLRFLKFVFSVAKKVFAKKTILFVSKNKIKTFSISAPVQMILAAFVIWSFSLFWQLLKYDSIIKEKTYEITNLKDVNRQFEREVDSLNKNLEKINNYFSSTLAPVGSFVDNNPDNEEKKQEIRSRFHDIFGNLDLDKSDKKIALKIAESNLILSKIEDLTRNRIDDLEQKIAITGIKINSGKKVSLSQKQNYEDNLDKQISEISLNNESDLRKKQGGPLRQLGNIFVGKIASATKNNATINIGEEIEHLVNLENFIKKAPLSIPMKNYYVSSGFGSRVDPIRGVRALHQGMDFVGREGESVLSPSSGRVIFAGRFGAYGNGIVIDHGYNITTRYGHLLAFKVSEGDYVKRGQIIALQGNSGRSTGPHLHYEVRYKNVPLNPKKFLQAGQKIFNNNINLN